MVTKIILVVEDEPNILRNLTTILEISGYKCLSANNGSQAVELLKNNTPHLVLCDVMMPEMNGFDLLEYILSTPSLSQISFCFLTALADVIEIDKGLELGAKAYITKPFVVKDLLQKVKLLIG
jgi:DNA-binding response OmpR family regulator